MATITEKPPAEVSESKESEAATGSNATETTAVNLPTPEPECDPSTNAKDETAPDSPKASPQPDATEEWETDSDSDQSSEGSSASPSLKNTSIIYTVEVLDTRGNPVRTVRSDRPFPFEAKKGPTGGDEDGEEQTVFEVFTDVVSRGKKADMEAFSQWESGEDVRKLPVKEVRKSRIDIYSQVLLEAIRSVVSYYPGQNLAGDIVTIHEPFAVLIHHRHELKALQAAGAPEDVRSKHIGHLFKYLDPFIERVILPEERRYKKPTPSATFDNLWLLLKPGTFIYELFKGKDMVHCVAGVELKADDEMPGKSRPTWEVHAWNILASGEKITRHSGYSYINHFEGEIPITSLMSVPLEYMDAADGGEKRKKLVERGKKFFWLMDSKFKQAMYEGYVPNLSAFPQPKKGGIRPSFEPPSRYDPPPRFDETRVEREKFYRGMVIIDPASALAFGKVSELSGWFFDGECRDREYTFVGQNGPVETGSPFKWEAFDNITPETLPELTEEHYLLASPVMAAFGLKDKAWSVFDVDCFREITREELQKPILPQGEIEVIEALAYRQDNMQKAWRPDFIQDKGEGQIVLLHGPPGVGKTYTVEWIASTTGRPLLSLAIADIGTEEQSIEGELMKWFYFAESWNAILLIDEADIFLERRSNYDLARNGIVSVFLRQMEYFRGILFLTTNRVGHIDDAFLSRVHVVLEYKSLDGETSNRIWEAFFAKLQRDMKGRVVIHSRAKRHILDRKEGSDVQWSGREIRNTLQTAVALAEYEASKEEGRSEEDPVIVVSEHFDQVMKMSQAFRKYMTSVHASTEVKRAQLNRDRNDKFQDRS